MGQMEAEPGDQSGDRQGPTLRTGTRAERDLVFRAAPNSCAPAAADPGHLPAVRAAPGHFKGAGGEPGHREAVWGPWPASGETLQQKLLEQAGEDCQLGRAAGAADEPLEQRAS